MNEQLDLDQLRVIIPSSTQNARNSARTAAARGDQPHLGGVSLLVRPRARPRDVFLPASTPPTIAAQFTSCGPPEGPRPSPSNARAATQTLRTPGRGGMSLRPIAIAALCAALACEDVTAMPAGAYRIVPTIDEPGRNQTDVIDLRGLTPRTPGSGRRPHHAPLRPARPAQYHPHPHRSCGRRPPGGRRARGLRRRRLPRDPLRPLVHAAVEREGDHRGRGALLRATPRRRSRGHYQGAGGYSENRRMYSENRRRSAPGEPAVTIEAVPGTSVRRRLPRNLVPTQVGDEYVYKCPAAPAPAPSTCHRRLLRGQPHVLRLRQRDRRAEAGSRDGAILRSRHRRGPRPTIVCNKHLRRP